MQHARDRQALEGRVARVVISNPQKTRAIAEAKVKTDKVDAAVLAELLAADYLPAVWVADDATQALRRQVARRAHIVRQRTRLKNQVQAILHRNLIPRCPAADLFGRKGRRGWPSSRCRPMSARPSAALLRQLDFHGHELRIIDAELGRVALGSENTKRLMTIPGVDVTVAMSIIAAVGDFSRFRVAGEAGQLPRPEPAGQAVRRPARQPRADHQAGPRACPRDARRGRVGGVKTPGPLRAFYERVRARRGMQIAVVATARKLAVLCWHMITMRRGLRVRPTVADRPEAAPPRAAGPACRRAAARRATPPATRSRMSGRARSTLSRARRAGLPPARRRLAGQGPAAKEGVAAANGARLSRPSDGATAARQAPAPDPALRSGVDHAHTAA